MHKIIIIMLLCIYCDVLIIIKNKIEFLCYKKEYVAQLSPRAAVRASEDPVLLIKILQLVDRIEKKTYFIINILCPSILQIHIVKFFCSEIEGKSHCRFFKKRQAD